MLLKNLEIKLNDLLKPDTSYEWDNSGLLIGEMQKDIKSVMITLEIDEKVMKDAIDKKVDMIISHHPLIFKPKKNLKNSEKNSLIIMNLIKNDIAVYAAHTNYDIIKEGLNDYLAKLIGLTDIETLYSDGEPKIGRFGILKNKMDTEEFADHVSRTAGIKHLRIVKGNEKPVEKIGLVTGAGIEYINNAIDSGCDTFVTGDVKYHEAQHAKELGINILDIGHYASEIHFNDSMKEFLERNLDAKLRFVVTDKLEDPFMAFMA